jgi:RNA polymerase-interacting CarD/CdnL/TRCF family regulator
MPKFRKGDLVYHSFYGTGIITSTQRLDLSGAERLYYVVELTIGEVLMIPIKETGEARLHPPVSPEAISDILFATPEELSDDFRQRRKHIEEKVNSGDPTQIAEVLRDLAWREHTAQLSRGDRGLMRSTKKLLTNILVMQPDLGIWEASRRLETILEQIILVWETSG